MVNKTSVTTYGDKSLTLDFGLRRIYRWIFTVADITFPILGADFLAFHDLTVDVFRRKLIDCASKLSIHCIQTHDFSPCPVFAKPDADNPYAHLLTKFPTMIRPSYSDTPMKHSVTHHICTKGPPVVSRA